MNPVLPLAVNTLFSAFYHSDFLGKAIFFALFALSTLSWIVIVHKFWMTRETAKQAAKFQESFRQHKRQPLKIERSDSKGSEEFPNPFYQVYHTLRHQTLEILSKNKSFAEQQGWSSQQGLCLSSADLGLVEAHSTVIIADQTQRLEKHLFILSTIVHLAPLLGLLGTVWGITMTFGELQGHAMASTNQLVLSGLSMALATTVLGLVIAIPALIGNNYLRHVIDNFQTEMENFAQEVINAIEMHYRKVDVE